MRAGRGFGMILDAINGFSFVAHALDGLIVEVDAVDLDRIGKGMGIDCEAMVLGSDFDFAGFEVLNGLIGAAMAKFQFKCFSAESLAQDLVAEANAKDGNAGIDQV